MIDVFRGCIRYIYINLYRNLLSISNIVYHMEKYTFYILLGEHPINHQLALLYSPDPVSAVGSRILISAIRSDTYRLLAKLSDLRRYVQIQHIVSLCTYIYN